MNGWRCPDWCAGDHQCTVQQGHPAGVHASDPMRWNTAYGSLVAVRHRNLDGHDWLELRVHARLGRTDLITQEQASTLAVQVDLAVRGVVLVPSSAPPAAIVGKGQTRRA